MTKQAPIPHAKTNPQYFLGLGANITLKGRIVGHTFASPTVYDIALENGQIIRGVEHAHVTEIPNNPVKSS